MHDVRRLGIEEVVRQALELVGPEPAFLSVDIDCSTWHSRRVGSADVTALAADRVVREIRTGIALRRRG